MFPAPSPSSPDFVVFTMPAIADGVLDGGHLFQSGFLVTPGLSAMGGTK